MSFQFLAAALSCTLLVSAATPYPRSVRWLQQNGPAAKALNDQYAALTSGSSCNDGDIACINGQFATCYDGHYVISPCPSAWSCAAVPNEWSEGTTTTCDTNDNISSRFSQAGISEFKKSLRTFQRDMALAHSAVRRTSWLQQNGPAAKALNDQYAALTSSSSCSDGDIACVNGQYAVCYEGRYAAWSCSSGWTCAAIPNEWSEGTTTTCDTNEDIAWRFSQAGISEF